MKGTWMIGGLMLAATGLEAETGGAAMANNSQQYDALLNLAVGSEDETSLLQMSDTQLASIIGGEVGSPLQVPGGLSGDQSRQVTQILNQVLAGQNGQKTTQPASNTSTSTTSSSSTNTVQQSGDQVTAQQTQTGTQTNGPTSGVVPPSPNQSNNQVNSLQQVTNVMITPQGDGTTKIVAQQGTRTTTIIIPFPISAQALINAIPFQVQVSVERNVVNAINQLSGPMIGNPATILRTLR
jgi:hypothetical protein